MAVESEASKSCKNQRGDRLSSLPDDIVIGILSRLPLQHAIVFGSLSSRWRGLWRNVTCIDITKRTLADLAEFFSTMDNIMSQVMSPFVHSFRVEIKDWTREATWQPSLDDWLRQICDRNIREVEVTHCRWSLIIRLPGFLFQTPSLVSLKLDSTYTLKLPDDCDRINLPNLKKLDIVHRDSVCGWLGKLIEACPSLEELSLCCEHQYMSEINIRCSNRNLRRLFFRLDHGEGSKVAFNTPNLEYLSIIGPESATFCFDEEPIMLREAEIEITFHPQILIHEQIRLMSKFYRAISNTRILTLKLWSFNNISTLFHNTTQLTLISSKHDFKTVQSLANLCPVLDSLIIKYRQTFYGPGGAPRTGHVEPPTLPPSLKKIKIEGEWCDCWDNSCVNNFGDLATYLLRRATNLEYFVISLTCCKICEKWTLEDRRRSEFKLCKDFDKILLDSAWFEAEFKGTHYNMSRKAGSIKAWSADGEVISFNLPP